MDFLDTICYNTHNGGDYMATSIGTRIMERRKQLGWTQDDLAIRMGYKTKSAINKIELGINDVSQSKVVKFAEVLGVSVAYLMDWEETRKKNDVLSDIILKMNEDAELLEMVEALSKLGFEKREAVKSVLNAFATIDE